MTDGTPYIELRKVSKILGGRPVLQEMDLAVKRGETLVVMGASGSGKSVTLRHIVGLMRPDRGQILVDGEDVTRLSEKELVRVRHKVAMIFQGGALFDSMTVGENVAFGLVEQGHLTSKEIAARVSRVLASVGLEGTEEKLPADLSGGMRKRVAVARSMVLEPECLLYDEPTTGLDPVTGFKVVELIREMNQGEHVTGIVVTHDVPAAFFVADRIAFLAGGRIAFLGTPDEARRCDEPGLREFLSVYGGGGGTTA